MDCSGLRDDLLDVLYGEAGDDTRHRVLTHAASCAACRDELGSLRVVRSDLQRWKAPDARPLGRRPTLNRPAFLATAAAVLFASVAALSLRGSELRYEDGRMSLRLGRETGETGRTGLRQALEEQEARHRREMAELRASLARAPQPAASAIDHGAVLREVAEMIRDSEARQGQKLQTGLVSLAERAEARRRYDLARIGASLAYVDGRNGQQLSRTTELMGTLLEASQKRGER
jgi:hypothetical protein